MIYEIQVTNPSENVLKIELTKPEASGFIVRDIQGLGPAKTNINIRNNASVSGSVFNSAITPSRNIVLTLEFVDYILNSAGKFEYVPIETTRLKTYTFFPNESQIRLAFRTDSGTKYICGYVESNEPNIFSQNQGCIISVICPDPYFREFDRIEEGESTPTSKLFEFPFSNEIAGGLNPVLSGSIDGSGNFSGDLAVGGITDFTLTGAVLGISGGYSSIRSTAAKLKTIIFGERSYDAAPFPLEFIGTVPVGPTLYIYAEGGPVVDPTIYFYNPNDPNDLQHLAIKFTQSLPALDAGDYLKIVCEKQNKSVTKYDASAPAGSQYLNYIGSVTLDSSWPLLVPGTDPLSDNMFSYTAEEGATNIRFRYEYDPKYIGI